MDPLILEAVNSTCAPLIQNYAKTPLYQFTQNITFRSIFSSRYQRIYSQVSLHTRPLGMQSGCKYFLQLVKSFSSIFFFLFLPIPVDGSRYSLLPPSSVSCDLDWLLSIIDIRVLRHSLTSSISLFLLPLPLRSPTQVENSILSSDVTDTRPSRVTLRFLITFITGIVRSGNV